jgi:hypothetical protein
MEQAIARDPRYGPAFPGLRSAVRGFASTAGAKIRSRML